MHGRTLTHIGALGLALLIGAGALATHARPAAALRDEANPPGEMAVIDMERIFNASDAPLKLSQKAAQIDADAQQRLNTIVGARFLDLKELQEYVELVGKLQPTPAEADRMKALKEISDKRQGQLDALNVKPQAELTPADKTAMRDLNDKSHLIEKVLPNLEEGFQTDSRERIQAYRREEIVQLRTVVAQVAKEKGIAHVFDVNALVYSSTDLTPLVLQKLNKKGGK